MSASSSNPLECKSKLKCAHHPTCSKLRKLGGAQPAEATPGVTGHDFISGAPPCAGTGAVSLNWALAAVFGENNQSSHRF